MRSGELFAGVGGLGMAVDEVFGSAPAWFAEFDAAPSKVLAYRYPDVPNLGDVTRVDWASLEHVDILAGGFPCQDVSLAGARRGMKDGTRSGLWSEYVKAIDTIRPGWVVIENVRGLINARADSEVEPCTWCVGDGDDEYHLRALDAVLADLSRLGYDATWTPLRAADVGAPHGRYRFFILAWPSDRVLPDAASFGRGEGWAESARLIGRPDDELGGAGSHLTLLPTPAAGNFNDGEDIDQWLERRDRVKEATGNGNGMGMPLSIAARLLPTPGAYDGERGGSQHPDKRRDGGHSVTLQDVAEHMTDWAQYTDAIRRWEAVMARPAPAPVRNDGKGGKARLNPELTEWMMGWPAGWVTDPAIGLSRSEQLKACGNGVVPQQAAAALRILLGRALDYAKEKAA